MPAQAEAGLVIGLVALQNKIQKKVGGSLSSHGISLTEYMVLRQLLEASGTKMRRIDLAEKTGLSASGITRLLNPMEKIGLVQKEENARDARVSLVALTDIGRRVFQEATASFDSASATIFSAISAKQLAALAAVLGQLVKE